MYDKWSCEVDAYCKGGNSKVASIIPGVELLPQPIVLVESKTDSAASKGYQMKPTSKESR